MALYQQKVNKTEKTKCLSNLELALMKFVSKTFSKLFSKLLYERSKDQLLSQSRQFKVLYQSKVNENEVIFS